MQQLKDIELFALQTHLFYLTNFSLLQKQESCSFFNHSENVLIMFFLLLIE